MKIIPHDKLEKLNALIQADKDGANNTLSYTVSQLADMTGLSVGTIHHHLKARPDILSRGRRFVFRHNKGRHK